MTQFSELGLSSKVLAAVEAAGYTTPTPIQAEAIPHALSGRDVLGIAQTGTGKTASFVLPMITMLERGRARARMPRTLILEPTRELATQVAENFETYGAKHKLNVALLIGGVSFKDQVAKLDKGADVLIATPGRLLDLFERGNILLTGCELLVIDEADRMLDMGFIPDIERIVKMLPFTRQTLFFSATMPPVIEKLASQFLQNPVSVEVARASSTSDTIEQKLVSTPSRGKDETLRKLIDTQDISNAIIFCNRKRDIGGLYKFLKRAGYSVGELHGDMDQTSRTRTLDGFRSNDITLLVASDVAARGLDIPDVSHVFNYDVPIHAEDYVHRIGRTGRAGREGRAFTLVASSDQKYLDAILHLTGDSLSWTDDKTGSTATEPAHDEVGVAEERPRKRRRSLASADEKVDRSRQKRPRRTGQAHSAATADLEGDTTPKTAGPSSEATDGRRAPKKRDRRLAERDPAPAGFGDHAPAFLLQPAFPAD